MGYRTMTSCAVLALTGVCAPAAAAQADADPQVSVGGSTALDDIVITARRREESAQSVPIAVTALGEDTLKSRQVFDAKGLEALVPSLNINSGNSREGGRYTLRGQGATLAAGESVAVYFAEAPVPQYVAGGPGFFYDLANVQVLNGPQGTLFGKNTTGGAVLFTPRMPTDNFEGYIEGAYGNYDNRELTGALNVPLAGDRVTMRVSGLWRKRDGFTRNIVSGKDLDNLNYWSARAILSVKVTENLKNDTIYSHVHSTSNGTSFIIDAVNPAGPIRFVPSYLTTAEADLALRFQNGARVTTPEGDPFYRVRAHTLVNTTSLELGSITAKNIFSYFYTRLANGFDIDGTRAPLVNFLNRPDSAQPSAIALSDHKYLTDEFQLQGDTAHLDWVAGAYYSQYRPHAPTTVYQISFGSAQNQTAQERGSTKALFAQGTLDLRGLSAALANLKLTAGYRYTWERKAAITSTYVVSTGLCVGTGGTSGFPAQFLPNCTRSFSDDYAAGTYTVSLDWQATPDTLFYAARRSGYKSGGFNSSSLPSQPFAVFGPERVINHEVGVKTTQMLGPVRARLNVAGFLDDYQDIQRNQTVSVVGTVPPRLINLVLNAASARIKGVEAQFGVSNGGVAIDGFYSFLDSKYRNFVLSGVNLAGVALPYSPRHKFSLSPSFTFPAGAGGEIVMRWGYSYQSSFRASDVDQPFNIVPARGLFNASIDWNNVANKPLDLSFFVTNLTDETYIAQPLAYYFSIGTVANAYGEPRMFGMRARYRFGN